MDILDELKNKYGFFLDPALGEAIVEIERLRNSLNKYSCKCTEPCALYKAEKEREGDMPHMMCGWWSVAALNGNK
jgi:hypothetical protein